MGETPGERKTGQGGFMGGLATSALANSTAFGYSIMITSASRERTSHISVPRRAPVLELDNFG